MLLSDMALAAAVYTAVRIPARLGSSRERPVAARWTGRATRLTGAKVSGPAAGPARIVNVSGSRDEESNVG